VNTDLVYKKMLNDCLTFYSVFNSFTSLSKKFGQNLKSGITKDNIKQGAKIKKNIFSQHAIDSR